MDNQQVFKSGIGKCQIFVPSISSINIQGLLRKSTVLPGWLAVDDSGESPEVWKSSENQGKSNILQKCYFLKRNLIF